MTLDPFNAFTVTVTPQSVLWKYTLYVCQIIEISCVLMRGSRKLHQRGEGGGGPKTFSVINVLIRGPYIPPSRSAASDLVLHCLPMSHLF